LLLPGQQRYADKSTVILAIEKYFEKIKVKKFALKK
jgi:hypothetical protein